MNIINIGMNHETAPVELRERLSIEPEKIRSVFASLKEIKSVRETFLLCTCNRVEALLTSESIEQTKEDVISLMSGIGRISEREFSSASYILEDMEAVRHVFRVASGLDSMVVGEPQIMGQIKDAYLETVKNRSSGVILNRLMHRAFHAAKRVRTETGICESAVSIGYAAVELAKKIFYSLEGKNALLIGAGDMAELTARHLMSQGISSLTVANRTFERAIEVATRFNAKPVSFEEIGSQLASHVDVVVASTASPEYVITHKQVKNCLRKRRNRPLFFIDIAVPRDVEPKVNDLSNVYVYDIDNLKGVVRFNMKQRQEEALKAERIIMEEVSRFEKWLKTLNVVPTIVSLRQKAETIIQAEFRRSSLSLSKLTPDQKTKIDVLMRSIAEKLLNDPILFLKKRADRPTVNRYLDFTKRLFNLNGEDENMEE